MKMTGKLLLSGFIALFALSILNSNVYAISLGTNITIYDGSSSADTGWYGKNEDQEVEPRCIQDQVWDLEGFFLNGSELQVVGGFDFKNGVTENNTYYGIGDIFLDTNGNYKPFAYTSDERANKNVNNNFGYEYVLDIDVAGGTYNVYSLSGDDVMTTVFYNDVNGNSNPWRYVSGGTLVGTANHDLTYEDNLSDSAVGFEGGTHYALDGLDLGFLNGQDFTAHLTMSCGNDNLMGSTAPVPEPATIILMGFGLIGIAGFGRKHLKK